MYAFDLKESYIPAQTDDVVLETTVGELLRQMAAERPDAPALVEIDMEGESRRRWTFGEVLADSERLALSLASRFKKGERVAVWAPNIPEWVLMEYACALAGLVLVTANPAYQPQELRYVLEQSGAVGLFLVAEYRGNPMDEIAAIATQGLANLREQVNLEDAEALFATGTRSATLPGVTPDDPAQIQYTSGTTGFPKGAVLSHRGLTNNARFFNKRARTHGQSVVINMMPMFHTSGCGMITLGSLQAGCLMLIVKTFAPLLVLKVVAREKVTSMLGVPTMLIALLEVLQNDRDHDLSSMEMVVSGGSMVAPELVRKVRDFMGCEFETVYGQTETSPLITEHHHTDSVEDICNTVGQPMPQTEVSIRSVDDNHILPVDTVGEICARGYCTMIGYHANEQATNETIDSDGWLHTGDLGALDARGYLRITGRVKEIIIRGGENMFPAEIENCLLEHPLMAEVAVVGLPDEKWGEIIACFFRTEGDVAVDSMELRQHCRANLAPQKTPVTWVRVKEFPLTGSGKIQKFALRDAFVAGEYKIG